MKHHERLFRQAEEYLDEQKGNIFSNKAITNIIMVIVILKRISIININHPDYQTNYEGNLPSPIIQYVN